MSRGGLLLSWPGWAGDYLVDQATNLSFPNHLATADQRAPKQRGHGLSDVASNQRQPAILPPAAAVTGQRGAAHSGRIISKRSRVRQYQCGEAMRPRRKSLSLRTRFFSASNKSSRK